MAVTPPFLRDAIFVGPCLSLPALLVPPAPIRQFQLPNPSTDHNYPLFVLEKIPAMSSEVLVRVSPTLARFRARKRWIVGSAHLGLGVRAPSEFDSSTAFSLAPCPPCLLRHTPRPARNYTYPSRCAKNTLHSASLRLTSTCSAHR